METQLQFSIKNQRIRRTDHFKPVADSENYLYAHFDFLTDEWDETQTKTALFTEHDTGKTYGVVLDDNGDCVVPHEVLNDRDGGYITVSVFSGSIVTANTVKVFVAKSGYTDDAQETLEPTPTAYQQMVRRVDALRSDMNYGFQHIDGGTFNDWKN